MRFLLSNVVQKFKGIAQYPPINTVSMDWATNLLNVIVNKMGWVAKFRLPALLSPQVTPNNCLSMFYYSQAAANLRQLVMFCVAGTGTGIGGPRQSPDGQWGEVVPNGIGILPSKSEFNFTFSIPASATITGIQLEFPRSLNTNNSGAVVTTNGVQLISNGVPVGSVYSSTEPWTTIPTNETYGGQGDLWGMPAGFWTPIIINNSAAFGAGVSVAYNNPGLDISAYGGPYYITIFYTTSAQPNPYVAYVDTTSYPSIAPAVTIDSNSLYAPPWDAVESNNILYMANGQVMKKWLGYPDQPAGDQPAVNLPNWGLPQPLLAPSQGWQIPISGISRNTSNVVTITLAGTPGRRWAPAPGRVGPYFALMFGDILNGGLDYPPLPTQVGYDTLYLSSTSHPELNGIYYIVPDGSPNEPNTILCTQASGSSTAISAVDDSGAIIFYTSSAAGESNTIVVGSTYVLVGEAVGGVSRIAGVTKLYMQGATGNPYTPDMVFFFPTSSSGAGPYETITISAATLDPNLNGTFPIVGYGQDSTGFYVQINQPSLGDLPLSYNVSLPQYGYFSAGITFDAAYGSYYLVAYSYKNSVTGEEGPISPILSMNAQGCFILAMKRIYFLAGSYPPDPQVDTICWYRSQLGDGTLYLNREQPLQPISVVGAGSTWISYYGQIGVGQFLNDGTPDTNLNTGASAPIINFPPPVGKYLTRAQNRIFISGLVGAPQDIAYSAYETVLRGRPETCFYPYNRIRLALGADPIAGHGFMAAGLVIWDTSNRMFQLTGAITDITIATPTAYTEQLEELPYQVGLINHYTVKNTDSGLVFVDSALHVRAYTGTASSVLLNDSLGTTAPRIISTFITPFMQNINPACYRTMRATYLNWMERNWYVLSVADKNWNPVAGQPQFNWAVFFDCDPNEVANTGIFLVQIFHDCIAVVEDSTGARHLTITGGYNPVPGNLQTYGGWLFDVKIASNTVGGLTSIMQRTRTTGQMPAFYHSGYYGSDNPQVMKMFRFGGIVTDGLPTPGDPGFAVTAFLVNDKGFSFLNPEQKKLKGQIAMSSSFAVNKKARRCALKVDFPITDEDCNMIELRLTYRPISER